MAERLSDRRVMRESLAAADAMGDHGAPPLLLQAALDEMVEAAKRHVDRSPLPPLARRRVGQLAAAAEQRARATDDPVRAVQWWLTASALWKAYVRERGTRRGERANWWAIEARTWAQRRAFAIDETDPRLPPTVRAYARRATGDVELAVSTTDVGWTPASVNRFVDDGIGRLRVVGPWNRAPFAEGLRRALTDAVLSDPANAEAVIARAEEAVSQLPPPVDAAFARVVADAFRVTDDDERAKEWRVRADALAAEHKPGPGRFDRDRGHERS